MSAAFLTSIEVSSEKSYNLRDMDDQPGGRVPRPDTANHAVFLSFVAHELRAPLTVALGTLSMLESGSFGAMPDQQQRAVRMAARAVTQINTLTDDLSTAARIARGEWPLTTTAVMMHDIIADVGHALQQSNTAVSTDIPSDASRLTVVVDRVAIVRAAVALARLAGRETGLDAADLGVERRGNEAWLVISAGAPGAAVRLPGTVDVDPVTSGMGFALFVAASLLALHGLRAVRLDAPPDSVAFGIALPL